MSVVSAFGSPHHLVWRSKLDLLDHGLRQSLTEVAAETAGLEDGDVNGLDIDRIERSVAELICRATYGGHQQQCYECLDRPEMMGATADLSSSAGNTVGRAGHHGRGTQRVSRAQQEHQESAEE